MDSLSSLLSLSPYSRSKNNQPSIPQNKRHGVNYVSCRASNGENYQNPQAGGDSVSKFDRRDVLFGLGGLYGVTTLGSNKFALAESSLSPDVRNCGPAKTPAGEMDCCPPKINRIIDFTPPIIPKLQVRPALQFVTPKQLEDLQRGIEILKNLKPDDPRNFYQQAKVHCAYCDHAYKQVGSDPQTDFQVHFNALFFPFHRAYLHFFERILRHFIGDPNFALPFWNWDAPIGMHMPIYYNHNPNSSLYDENRDPRHKAPKVLDLNYDGTTENPPYNVVDCNLRWMNKQMSVKTNRKFLGKVIKVGETAVYDDSGTIEKSPHNNVHDWVGDPNNPNGEDMGVFYSAARDPIFYAHHANVDRMWNIWQKMNNDKKHYSDPDWLNSSFVFYDERKNAVRIKVSDCLDSENLGYVYEDVDIPWLHTKQIPRNKKTKDEPQPPIINFPQILNSAITTMVERPSVEEPKDNEEEVLVIEDVVYDPTLRLHFNVLVNVLDDGDDVCPGNVEFVGSFKNIPHGLKHQDKTSLRFVLTEVIEMLGLKDAQKLAVKIVPKTGGDQISIGGIKIQIEPVE